MEALRPIPWSFPGKFFSPCIWRVAPSGQVMYVFLFKVDIHVYYLEWKTKLFLVSINYTHIQTNIQMWGNPDQ